MGNIFKTLGLDDLARKFLPGIGNTIADVMVGLPMGQKSGPGAGEGNFLNNVSMGPNPGRMSNEDYQHNQNLLDSSNPREIARTGSFLEGVAPSQGRAWNTYQDETYGADTDRAIERTQKTGDALGMSPWEVMGLQGSTPLAPTPAGPTRGSGESYLGQMTPLAIAKMNNETALKQTEMNNNTSLKQTEMQTAGGEAAKSQIAKNKQDMAESASRILQQEATTAKTFQDIEAQAQTMIVQVVETALKSLPEETLTIGGYNRRQRQGAGDVLRQLANRGQGTYDADKVRQWLSKFGQNEMRQLADDLQWWGKLDQGVNTVGKGIGALSEGAGAFLKGITGASKYTHELKDF